MPESEKEKSPVKTVSFIMVITLVGKVLGLLRDRLLTVNYGSGMEANAFLTASRIPRVFFDTIFASAISASFIPVFSEYLKKKSKREAMAFAGNFITVMALLCAVFTALGAVFAPQLTTLFADGYDAATAALCTRLTRIMLPTALFTGVAFSFVGILQSMDEFNIPAAISLFSNGLVIAYYYTLNKKFGVTGLAVAFLAAWLLQALVQLPALRRKGFSFVPSCDFGSDGMKKVFRLMLPVMVSTWVLPINQTINSKFGSRLFSGAGVSAIDLSYNLYTVIAGVFVLSVTNYIFPRLSRENASGDRAAFRRTISGTMHAVLYVVLPMTAGLFVMAGPLIGFIYGGGKFDAFSISITSRALMWMSLGMVGYAAQAVLCRVYFAEQSGKVPLIAGAVSIAANVALCAALAPRFDVAGIAVASAIAFLINGVALALPLHRRGMGFADKKFVTDMLKAVLASLVMAAVVYVLRIKLAARFGKMITLAVPTVTGMAVYFVLTLLLRLPEAVKAAAALGPQYSGGTGIAEETEETYRPGYFTAPEGPSAEERAARAAKRAAAVKGSVVLRAVGAAAGWVDSQWAKSPAAQAFVRPPRGRAASESSVFRKLMRALHALHYRFFHALRLDRLFYDSIFTRAFLWCLVTSALATLIPTMAALGLCLVSFLALFVCFGMDRKRELAYSPANRWIWLYAFIYLVSTFTSVTPAESLKGGVLMVAFILFSIVLQSSVRTRRQADFLVTALVAAGTIVAAYGLYQYVFGASANDAAAWVDRSVFKSLRIRVYSTLENPNVLAEYLLLVIPLAASCIWTARTNSGKTLAALALAAMLGAMLLTFSRGGWLGLLITAALFLILLDRRFLFLGIALLAALFVFMPTSVVDRFTSIGNLDDSSTYYRVAIWMGSLKMLKTYWFCGIGPGTAAFAAVYPAYSYSSVSAPHSHNLFLQVTCDSGIAGLVTFAAIVFMYFKTTASALSRATSKKARIRLIALNSGMLGFMAQGMTDYSFYNYRVALTFWVFTALAMILSRDEMITEDKLT